MENGFKLNWSALPAGAPEWYRNAKFGLFFHWGPYSVPAFGNEFYSHNMYDLGQYQHYYHEKKYGKLSEFGYKDFMPMFTAPRFNPDEWADMIAESGARYAGPVSEHADNFSMWNSRVNPVNSMTYMRRDVVGECFEAFRRRGIRTLCSFHHQFLWGWYEGTDPDADSYDPKNERFYGKIIEEGRLRGKMPDTASPEFCQTWLNKLTECVCAYKPDMVYFDGMLNILPEEIRLKAIETIFKTYPNALISSKGEDLPDFIGIKDLECKRYDAQRKEPWQSGDRLETNITWCWVEGTEYKTPRRVIESIADVVSKNGNYLMNIGPKADGTFDERAKSVLKQVGVWLKTNGEAIYATRPFEVYGEGSDKLRYSLYGSIVFNGKFGSGISHDSTIGDMGADDVRFTLSKDGKTVYAILMSPPKDMLIKTLKTGGVLENVSSVRLLDSNASLGYERSEDGLKVFIPEGLDRSMPVALAIAK